MTFHLTLKSTNRKTGPIPVSTSPRETCPSTCSFRGAGCYAENFPMSVHWDRVSDGSRGMNWLSFMAAIRELPEGQLWRHNQAGDLPGIGDEIDFVMMMGLSSANDGRRGYTYTHKHHGYKNRALIKVANDNGFTVNLSADNLKEAEYLAGLDISPVVVVVPKYQKTGGWVRDRKLIICPALLIDAMTCAACQMCADPKRKTIIAFPAHGASATTITDKLAPKLF